MRILITGAGGFVGSHLTAYLAEAGHTVYAARHPEDHGSLSAAAAVYGRTAKSLPLEGKVPQFANWGG